MGSCSCFAQVNAIQGICIKPTSLCSPKGMLGSDCVCGSGLSRSLACIPGVRGAGNQSRNPGSGLSVPKAEVVTNSSEREVLISNVRLVNVSQNAQDYDANSIVTERFANGAG